MINALLGARERCACGAVHSCSIDRIVIKRGALAELHDMTADFSSILLVCDENTRRVCGERVDAMLSDKIKARLTYTSEPVIPNEGAIEEMEAHLTHDTDLIIGVGSGVINDLCKHVSHLHGLPYYIVATAPSMDGYASRGAAMILGNMKITTDAAPPKAIIADTEVLADAPIDMLRAGYGDIIGKFSCLNDWKLSHAVNGEPLCEYIWDLTYKTVCEIAPMGRQIASRDGESVEALMRALVVVGIAMAYMGNSRPASGSEHHLSHYFEVTGLLRGEPYFCHGIDVAYSTYETARLREELISIDSPKKKRFDKDDWEKSIMRVYSTEGNNRAAEGIIALQNRLSWIYRDRIDIYRDRWSEIKDILKEAPDKESVSEMLESVGLRLEDYYKIYSDEKRADAIRYAKDLKDRYTVLWTYEDVETE
jgi:glycerol-1-phosphate dehydrogenase [NAD(P)+]